MSNLDHEIRIIGGKYKGKLLKVLDAQGLRPTTNKVRETVFTWLSNIEGTSVLDLFAGTGALGFEAASRGAKEVTLVELDKDSANLIKQTASSFTNSNIKVFNQDALSFLSSCNSHFDIVFIDPPYKLGIYEQVISQLNQRKLIDENSIIYVEMRNGSSKVVPGFEIYKEQTAGIAKYALWRKSKLLF